MPMRAGSTYGSDLRCSTPDQLVQELGLAHRAVQRKLEGGAAGGHAAVVELEDQEAVAREQAVARRDVLPGVGDGLGVRPAVDADDHRIAPRRIEVRGLEQRAVERRAVRGRELDPLEAAALVGQDRRAGVLVEHEAPRAVLARHHHARRRRDVRPGVGVEASVGRNQAAMGAVLAREPHAARAVEADAVQVPLARILLGRGEVDEAGALVQQQARTGAGEGGCGRPRSSAPGSRRGRRPTSSHR